MESKDLRIVMRGMKLFAFVLVAALLLATPVSAQYAPPKQQPAQQPPQQPAQPGAKPGELPMPDAPPVNKEEEDASKAFFALKRQDAATTIQTGEDFLQKYPDSRYRDSVYAKLLHAYMSAGKEDRVPATGEKALGINPDNVDVLAFMSWYLGHRHNSNALDAEQKLQALERYSRHGLELMANLQKPAGVADEDFARAKNEKQAMCHAGLGLFYYFQNKIPEMAAELEQSTSIDPTPDPVDFFLLADAQVRLKKYAEATASYERCSQVAWAWQEKCKSKLAQVKAIAAAQPAPAAAPAKPAPAATPLMTPEKPKPPSL